MKRKAFLLALTAGMLSGTASAENGWGNLGGILQQACSASQGNAAGMSFNTGKFGEKMQWLCQLQNIHGFIDNNILNGDWEAFAQDVAGKYLGQLANYIGDSMGDTSGVSHLLAGLNDAMNRNYGDFKQALYGTAVRGIGPGRSLNAGYSEGSVGNIAEKAIANNPTFALANSVARVSDAMNAAHGVQKAYQAKKIQDEAKKALESNTAQAMNAATNVIGTPTKEGLVDKYSKDAASAVSAREVSEVLVQITGEAMKQDATMSVALLNQLSELAQQQVMTNTQLMLERQSKEQEIARNEEEFKAEVEQMVAENNAQAAEFQRDIKSAYSNMSSILKADIKLEPVGE
ncbi:hypothetical protein D3875_03340 [Deinococcus cavernae]|uniref:Uncharacterized protein n=1 Tax=Deinococcus cavernae TaxID=2320857 RepID=A0A418VEQ0_9DEIO|nr:hypothetical protein [Deinococcus cavernae]RJF74588.1 hypothetical protein D3875_03340 [Deinococcus cavernae]